MFLGSALSSLRGMTAFLRGRPQSFLSLPQAIEWRLVEHCYRKEYWW